MFHRSLRHAYQRDEGIQFGNYPTKQVSQRINQSVYKRNEGILFSERPTSRPLHIYRKTGPNHVITSSNEYNGCTLSSMDWKMLGKNSYKYKNPNAPCGTCRVSYSNSSVTCPICAVDNVECGVPSKDCKAPYYHDNSTYIKKMCVVNNKTVPAQNVVKINNPNFPSTWGGVTSSGWTLWKKYETIRTNNQSLLNEYQRRMTYTETPFSETYRLSFKRPGECPADCYTK
jgi:hypothetical protein